MKDKELKVEETESSHTLGVEKEHVIYVLEFKRVTDTGEKYVSETQKLAETQHLVITQGLKRLFKDTQWTVEQLSFVPGHKSVSGRV